MRIIKLTQAGLLLAFGFCCCNTVVGQDSVKPTVEPVYRLSHNVTNNSVTNNSPDVTASLAITSNDTKLNESTAPAEKAPHPLDRALEIAESGLANIRGNIRDYTAIMVKRERVNGELLDPEFMSVKVRNSHSSAGKEVPFSIYMKFLKPRAVKGREVIWVKGRNEGKIIAHDAGAIRGLITVHLEPTGSFAMAGNRHPIYEAGIENLVKKLIEKGTRDRSAGPCKVRYVNNTKINKRSCTMIQVTHAEKKAPYEFHKAQIFIDDELQIPVRYASYLWPSSPGEKPPLLEEYTYVNVELNVGLTDRDFDPQNAAYDYN